jgi:hypothetical protein
MSAWLAYRMDADVHAEPFRLSDVHSDTSGRISDGSTRQFHDLLAHKKAMQ